MLCSVCLFFGDPDKGINIFNDMGMKLKIAKIIEQHMWIRPQPNDDNLQYICHPCWKALSEFHAFYEQAKKAYDSHQFHKEAVIIKEEFLDSAINLDREVEQFKSPDNQQRLNESIIINEENLDSTNIFNLEREEEQPAEQFQVNINNVSKATNGIAKNKDNSAKSSKYGKQSKEIEVENDSFPEQSFELLEEMEQINPSDDEDESESDIVSDKYEPIKIKRNLTAENSKSSHKPKKKKPAYEHDKKHTEEIIKKHIPMACSLCLFVCKTFFGIRKHFASCHPTVKPYILCCDRKLTKACFVAQHALTHEDPNCFNCLECDKSFVASSGLKSHNLKYHAPEEEKKYSCNLCPKKFARSYLLESHKILHIPKDRWQFFCTECKPQKPFASKSLLSIHKCKHHKRDKNVCPVCAKVFQDKCAFEKHVRHHIEDSGSRVPCPYPDCESWLKDECNLKLHMKFHNPEGIIYKCTECDMIFRHSRALSNHKYDMHSNRTFACGQCDKTYKKAISLKEHMAQHTGEKLYKCPFCSRTFNSGGSMHRHKKHQHFAEWFELRKNKNGSSQSLQ